ncbi:MAG: N-formylglutamate amidohydrolase [Pseudomonadota bacterium]
MMENTSIKPVSDAVSIYNERGNGPVLIVCEHASNHIPEKYDNLGLSDTELATHIAWDLGAADVAVNLARKLDAACVLGGVSRLLYDCNRPPEAHDAMTERSEVYTIPGNKCLSAENRQERVEAIYEPFKRYVSRAIKRKQALITIHSFTPVYNGRQRDVELGILHDSDTTLADCILESAHNYTGLTVCRNQPYGPQHGVTHTLKIHGVANGIPHVMIEIRNDLIKTSDACKEMSKTLASLISDALDTVLGSNTVLEKHA